MTDEILIPSQFTVVDAKPITHPDAAHDTSIASAHTPDSSYDGETVGEQNNALYSSALASINYINSGKPESMSDAQWQAAVQRNKDHIAAIAGNQALSSFDMQPLQAAIDF